MFTKLYLWNKQTKSSKEKKTVNHAFLFLITVFFEVNTYQNDNTASGDDVFLLHNVKQRYPNGIVWSMEGSRS